MEKKLKKTTVYFSENARNKVQYLGKLFYDFNYEDTSLKVIERQKLIDLVKNQNFEENTEGYSCFFVNSNSQFGELKYNIINFRKYTGDVYDYSLSMSKKFLKGQNVSGLNNKIVEIPLVRNGKLFSLNIQFGKKLKKYILDSGASDMSIDDETFQYLENTNQLKIENRLTDSKYQLADGSLVQFKRVRIPSFSLNDIVVKNIDATIIENGKPLLLGKSFLDSFKSWKIDNEKGILVIELF
jgi:predicted aspartyl protease